VIIAQAWKKSHGYIRHFNWYADTLALDVSALGLESNANNWAHLISQGEQTYELELVPAAKSESWTITDGEGWAPQKDELERLADPSLRPLAHITIRDQAWATAAMMCLADAVETAQGDCGAHSTFYEAQKNGVYSYGNRLLCDWKDKRA
jgi:hypothetical protein